MSSLSSSSGVKIGNEAWHAVYTKHQHEKVVAERLTRQGFETFLPLSTMVHQWRDRTKRLSLPLFPGYVFVRGAFGRRLEVLKDPSVHAIVEKAGHPEVIPEHEIAAIRRAVESSLQIEPHPFSDDGDCARIKSGPLAGLEGILIRQQDQLRLVLSVETLGQSVAVEVGPYQVELINGLEAKRIRARVGYRSAALSPV